MLDVVLKRTLKMVLMDPQHTKDFSILLPFLRVPAVQNCCCVTPTRAPISYISPISHCFSFSVLKAVMFVLKDILKRLFNSPCFTVVFL